MRPASISTRFNSVWAINNKQQLTNNSNNNDNKQQQSTNKVVWHEYQYLSNLVKILLTNCLWSLLEGTPWLRTVSGGSTCSGDKFSWFSAVPRKGVSLKSNAASSFCISLFVSTVNQLDLIFSCIMIVFRKIIGDHCRRFCLASEVVKEQNWP